MNLIQDAWIPVIRADGSKEKIKPYQIVEMENQVIDIVAPRPDFQGALYQFLIGLLQTIIPPEDPDEWLDLWECPPDEQQLASSFSEYSAVFELFTPDGQPAFLQDLDMPDGEEKPIASLIVEAPGGKTLKDNLDHFIKGDVIGCACEGCAATALFTLQTNAPSGGVGHRVGLRGGGPLTTLLIPESNNKNSLWHTLWLNVLTQEDLETSDASADIFPWLNPTRISNKSGAVTLPSDVNPLQMYWGMPRRIRLMRDNASEGLCSLCGAQGVPVVTRYRTKNYGVNYEGPWVHPLTPYRFDPKKTKPPLSLKGQQGGLGYRHWLGVCWMDSNNGDEAALAVRGFNAERVFLIGHCTVNLWCFGFDMDNMKARCWYDHKMPVVSVSKSYQELFIQFVSNLVDAARDVVKELRTQVKGAWFSRPKDTKGDTSMVDASFWAVTESAFYQQLQVLSEQPEDTRTMPSEVAGAWVNQLERQAKELFDYWVLEGDAEDLDMKRITKARRTLFGKLKSIKTINHLRQIASSQTEVA